MELNNIEVRAISVKLATGMISDNGGNAYKWYTVKNNKGCYIEMGGRRQDGVLEIKTYIPKIVDGVYQTYQNGNIISDYAISLNGWVEYPTFSSRVNLTEDEYFKFLNNTDFTTYEPKIKMVEKVVITEYRKIIL
jgi:hypothetical protein